jgi:hypothetical protein
MIRKSITILLALAILIAAVIAGAAEYLFNDMERRYGRDPKVVGMPDMRPEPAWATPYAGPHPARRPRPDETFRFPIALGASGAVAPLFAGPLQYPFLCMTDESGLGQPLVDNQDGIGMPVYDERDGEPTQRIIGYSKDCSLRSHVRYFYNRAGTDSFFPLAEARGDVARIRVGGAEVDFVVRVETGTINRHIYLLAALTGPEDRPAAVDTSLWNGRLIYQFKGGVGIGRRHGRVVASRILSRRKNEIAAGYAIAHSSANTTSSTYNIWLSEDTARRVKRQFAARYGAPVYTFGIGGSGGAIQQYLLAQNAPDVLDGGIPLYSYPDMVTQTTYALDCELAEHYFDVTDAGNERWRDWRERKIVEGLNSTGERSTLGARFLTQLMLAFGADTPVEDGLSECVKSWRGLSPLVHNPRYAHFAPRFAGPVRARTHWTYWEDLAAFYGRKASGYANQPYDNVGVQYGLRALRDGRLDAAEFLDLNARIGGWRTPETMTGERYWGVPGARSSLADTAPWSEHNQTATLPRAAQQPAPRSRGDRAAMSAAWWSGQAFGGRLAMPVIDLRHYLDDELDMHHSLASFQTRARIIREMGNADNQLIWVTARPHTPILEALAALERWVAARRVGQARPADLSDACFDRGGGLIAAGDDVWDGPWNGRPPGACTTIYPPYSTSRIEAGDDYTGERFACALQPVAGAIADGTYGDVNMAPHRTRLEEIFPDGVCDYALPDPSRPPDLFGAQGNRVARSSDTWSAQPR